MSEHETRGPRVIERGGRHLHLHSTTYGEQGPHIAFCHGLFGQGRNWTQIGKTLARDARVTLLDMPDHGRSPWSDRFSYVAMADAVAQELAALAPGERWVLVGHSMGGKAAMLLALRHPELLEGLVVVDIAPVDYRGLTAFRDYVGGMRGLPLESLPNRVAADEALRASVPDESVRAFLLQNLRREGQHWHWQMNLDLLGDSLRELGSWPADELDADAAYDGPTLWVVGADSPYVTREAAAPMRALFPRVRSVRVKGASHWVHADQPEIFLGALRRFLTGLEGPRG